MNLALHTEGKKKVNPLVILGVRFTKLIINHLQSIHKFHKRPGSPLHLPYEESALGYLKFSFKNTKRVRFGMAILDTLISENIRSATYYPEYVAKVAKYQWYLAGEVVSDNEAPAPKPANGAKSKTPRKPKPQSTSSQPPKPKPVPAKPQEKKRKLVMDATEAPSLAKQLKAGKVVKKRTLKSSHQLVDEFVDEGIPADEPRFEDEEADIMQKLMEESLKDSYLAPRGLIPPMVIREPEPGKFQPLPEVQGKGKEKVGENQAARMDSDEEVSPETNEEDQEEGQGGTNPGDVGVSQTPSSHVVYAGPNLDHMDLGIAEASSQPNTEEMDEEFTATAYPKVQENLKLPTEGDVRLEDPASSTATLSSLQNLDKEISFTNQFLDDLHNDSSFTTNINCNNINNSNNSGRGGGYTTFTSTTTRHFKLIIIQRIGELEQCIEDQVDANQALEEGLDKQGNGIHQLETQDLSRMIRRAEAIIASVQYAMRAPLRARFKDLPTSDMKEILLQRMHEENYDKGQEDHRMAYKALQKSILHDESKLFDADKAEERKKMKTSDSTQDPFPPPQSPTTNPDVNVFMHEESDFEAQDMVSDDEDIGSRHVPRVNLNQDWFKPLSEDERPATPEPAWSIPSSSLPVPIHNWMEECHKLLTNQVDDRLLRYNVSRPLPLGGPPGQVMIKTEFFFNRDLDYLRFGSKGDRLALSITKMKAAYYPDVGLEQMVPDQMSPEPPTAKGQEDSLYCCQLMDQESGYQTTGLEFMHDYKILDSPRAVLFKDKYGMHMLMRFNEIHMFSDRTLQQIDEALDYRVKEFKVNKNNLVLNTRTWKALLVEEYAKETTDFYGEPNDDIFSVASRTSCVTQAGSPPSMCQTISNIDAHVEGEQFHESKQSRYEFPRSCQSRRDLPRDNSLVSVEVLRYDYKRSNVNKGIVRTDMELVLEHTQQGLGKH
ncbi:hypothetical protein Tco_0343684 [Tanacetum coccineum]